MNIRTFILLGLMLLASSFTSKADDCAPVQDGNIKEYEVFRKQIFHSKLSRCIPDTSSFIQMKGKRASKTDILGFVVGLEILYHPELDSLLKVTSKTGAHTTVVTLLSRELESEEFSGSFRWEFYSSMEYIVVSRDGPEYIQVIVRNNEYDNNCVIVIEDKYHYIENKFNKISSEEVVKECI